MQGCLIAAQGRGGIQLGQRLAGLPQFRIQVKQGAVQIRGHQLRVELEAGAKIGQRLAIPPQVLQDDAAVVITPGKFGPQRDAGAVGAVREDMVPYVLVQDAELEKRPVMPRIELQRLLELGDGLLQVVLACERRGQQVVVAGACRSKRGCFGPRGRGAFQIAKLGQVDPAIVPQRGGNRQTRNHFGSFEVS